MNIMDNRRFSFIDVTLWALMLYLLLHVSKIEMRVDESEQPPVSTPKPEPHKQYLNNGGNCFHMPRSECPPEPNCTKVDSMSVFCCDLDSARLKESLSSAITSNTKYLHVRDSNLDELDVSQSIFSQLSSIAFTDGNIGEIVGSFLGHSSIACLNISHNYLTTVKLRPSFQRALVLNMFNLTVLDASANMFKVFPFNLEHSDRKISVDLSGNSDIPCHQFIQVINERNSPSLTFLNYENTYCAMQINYNWFKDTRIVQLKQVIVLNEIIASCRNIKPENSNCVCRPQRLEFPEEGGVIGTVAVDCSHRHLTVMPTNLPPNTVKLNVSYNNITSLQNVNDPSYDHLRHLIVDHNEITNILELEESKFIDNFLSFSIRYNKLTTIHTQVFSKLLAGGFSPLMYIGGNVIYCQCDTAKTLKPWLLKYSDNIPDYKNFKCEDNAPVIDLAEAKVCH